MPEQMLGWFSLDLGLVVEDEPSKVSCTLYNIAGNFDEH